MARQAGGRTERDGQAGWEKNMTDIYLARKAEYRLNTADTYTHARQAGDRPKMTDTHDMKSNEQMKNVSLSSQQANEL
jgi:hypothetical protein